VLRSVDPHGDPDKRANNTRFTCAHQSVCPVSTSIKRLRGHPSALIPEKKSSSPVLKERNTCCIPTGRIITCNYGGKAHWYVMQHDFLRRTQFATWAAMT
jgi:hypothetical protein